MSSIMHECLRVNSGLVTWRHVQDPPVTFFNTFCHLVSRSAIVPQSTCVSCKNAPADCRRSVWVQNIGNILKPCTDEQLSQATFGPTHFSAYSAIDRCYTPTRKRLRVSTLIWWSVDSNLVTHQKNPAASIDNFLTWCRPKSCSCVHGFRILSICFVKPAE